MDNIDYKETNQIYQSKNVIYISSIVLCFIIIIYAIYKYFAAYDKEYLLIDATVTEIDCNVFPINNHHNEYHCVTGIEYYPYGLNKKKYKNSLTFIDSEKFNVGDIIQIMVDKNNPLNIKVQPMSDQIQSIIMFLIAIILLIIFTGIRFIKLK